MAESHAAPTTQPGSGPLKSSNPPAIPFPYFIYLAGRLAAEVQILTDFGRTWADLDRAAAVRAHALRLAERLNEAAAHVAAPKPVETGTLLSSQQERELCRLLFDARRLAQAHVPQVETGWSVATCATSGSIRRRASAWRRQCWTACGAWRRWAERVPGCAARMLCTASGRRQTNEARGMQYGDGAEAACGDLAIFADPKTGVETTAPSPLVFAGGIFQDPATDYGAPTYVSGSLWQLAFAIAPQQGPIKIVLPA